MQLANNGEDLFDEFRRQTHRRLVHQNRVRVAHQGAAHRQHLLFAAGKRARLLVAAFLQAWEHVEHHGKIVRHVRPVFETERAHFKVFLHAHAREHVASFGNMRHAEGHDLIVRRFQQVHAVEQHLAGNRRSKTCDGMQCRGFASTVRTDQRHDLAVVHRQTDVFDRFDGTVGDGKILDLQHQASFLSVVSDVSTALFSASSAPRYAEMTCGLLAISSGVPEAMVRP